MAERAGEGAWERPQPKPDFTCAVCQRHVDMRWTFRTNRTNSIEPICSYCEHSFTQGIGTPKHGSFRDRREVMRGFAVAEALHAEAGHQRWRHPHVYAA